MCVCVCVCVCVRVKYDDVNEIVVKTRTGSGEGLIPFVFLCSPLVQGFNLSLSFPLSPFANKGMLSVCQCCWLCAPTQVLFFFACVFFFTFLYRGVSCEGVRVLFFVCFLLEGNRWGR
ncbi:hypothetical protein BKA57DRAFT_287769 [Linnemannia elongata]|nr:hypothetical protein BKA57DRAFT_287769 [Linnemannia elongata]